MKKYSIFLFAFLFLFALSTNSCSKNCKKGGWYGDRNLGFAPVKKKSIDTVSPIILNTEDFDCDISNP